VEPEANPRSEKKIHVLLVEDDDLDVLNAQRAMRDQPAIGSVTMARDGKHALDVLRSKRLPTRRLVVLLDLRMPGMGGLEFLGELRRNPDLHCVPVVVLSNSDAEEDRKAAYALNAAGYLVKPVASAALSRYMQCFCAYWANVEFPN
jgi:CheY-like chemotaxis protein